MEKRVEWGINDARTSTENPLMLIVASKTQKPPGLLEYSSQRRTKLDFLPAKEPS